MYKYWQPNKLDLKDEYGDCSIRALSKVFDMSWIDTYKLIIPYELKYQCPFPCMTLKLYKEVFKDLGFKYQGISNKKGSKRPTVKQFAKEHKKGTYILSLACHLVAVVDGDWYDTWRSDDKCLYGYYEKEIANGNN